MDCININNYIPVTQVEGPGKRFCIWVQGCSVRCPHCANSHMWNSKDGKIVPIKELTDKIAQYSVQIEGITFLGGEPLDQIEPVTQISQFAQHSGLSVMIFTGYDYKNLLKNDKFLSLKPFIDILVDGKYEHSKQDFSRPWVGSSNQNFYFLTQKYSPEILNQYKNKLEVRINPDNSITINGMGDVNKIQKLGKF